MLGLSGTLSYAVFVYLCICICVFVYETLGNISFDILGPKAFRKCMVCMAKTSYSGDKWRCHRCGTNERTNERTREDRATQPLDAGRLSFANTKLGSQNKPKI